MVADGGICEEEAFVTIFRGDKVVVFFGGGGAPQGQFLLTKSARIKMGHMASTGLSAQVQQYKYRGQG
jgi:hypothetical protein